jgi:hypothetical protein
VLVSRTLTVRLFRSPPLSREPGERTVAIVSRAFLGLTPDEIVARVQAAATAAADGPVVFRVGDDVHDYRNVGAYRCGRI